jgi:hypothetical protein
MTKHTRITISTYSVYDAETGEVFLNRGTFEESSYIVKRVINEQPHALIDTATTDPNDPTHFETTVINYNPNV